MSKPLVALALLLSSVSYPSARAADPSHGDSVQGADRPEWMLPTQAPPKGPVMIVRYGAEPRILPGGIKALDTHAIFPAPVDLPGVGPTRHLSGRYEFDCKGQVQVHQLLAQRVDGSRQAIDVVLPWMPVSAADEARPCHGGAASPTIQMSLVEAETLALIQAREGDPFGPKPDPIAAAPALKEVCSLVRDNSKAMRLFRTAALPVGPVSPLVALKAAAAKREPTGNDVMAKCLPAGRLADREHESLLDVVSRRAQEDGRQFSDEPPLRP